MGHATPAHRLPVETRMGPVSCGSSMSSLRVCRCIRTWDCRCVDVLMVCVAMAVAAAAAAAAVKWLFAARDALHMKAQTF